MPYIPPHNRPPIDQTVEVLAREIAGHLRESRETAGISVYYREVFMAMADWIAENESGGNPPTDSPARMAAASIIEAAKAYNQPGAWAGELNYALTRLIQMVPFLMFRDGLWEEPMRYWLYAQTVGALTRTACDVHTKAGNDYVGNALAGVFEDVKDEYKRRVNTSYEAAQITKSGDCFDLVPYRTELTPFEHNGIRGFIEIQLPHIDLAKKTDTVKASSKPIS